jgi:membrane-bound serine protease (ClpP class)
MDVLDPLAWSILLMVLGCALVVLEVFIPSGGVLSFLSAAAFVGAIANAFLNYGPKAGFTFFMVAVVVVPIVVALAFKYWPHTPMGKAFLGELPSQEEVSPQDPRRALVGRVGTARTKMLPSGAIEVEGQMLDAVSQGMAIDPGQYVVVTEVRGNRVVVRPANDDERPHIHRPHDLLSRPVSDLGLDSFDDPLSPA